ncbi:LytR family transcriptional regulator [Spirochaetia bacterium]|nr:LytR family transcriptional regulator [Spirochaetia bacterium]GHV29297.1 LytR family transcriptional regulator [Spirochaetia bacterium]
MRKIKADASAFLLALILLLLGGGIGFTILALRSDPIEEALSGDRVIRTLFIIEGDKKPLSSYVLFYYPETKRAAIFDIPGEVGLIIQRINRVDRIDTVYDPQRVSVFEREIEKFLGVDIDFSIVIELENLGKVVDLIEGVELFIPAPVEIYEKDNIILFPSGVTRLDGHKAQRYITYELPEEDRELAHFRRQRFFLGLIKRMGEKAGYLKQAPVAQIYQELLKTPMDNRTRTRLFDELAKLDTNRVNIQSVGGISREVSGQRLLFPLYDGNLIKEIVRQSLAALTRQMEGAVSERVFTVEVLNGTVTAGLAGRTADLIRGFGYDVISIGNADRSDYEITEVVDHSGYEDMVKTFAEIIRCQNIRFRPELEIPLQNLEYGSDFTLIIGKDFNGRYASGE